MTCTICGEEIPPFEGNYEVQTCSRECSYVLRSTVRVLRVIPKRGNNKTSIRNLLQIVEFLESHRGELGEHIGYIGTPGCQQQQSPASPQLTQPWIISTRLNHRLSRRPWCV